MRKQYDFSSAERGRFYRAEAELMAASMVAQRFAQREAVGQPQRLHAAICGASLEARTRFAAPSIPHAHDSAQKHRKP